MEQIKPVFNDNFVPILLQSDDKYAPYLCVCLESLVYNSNDSINYDIIVIERNISEQNKNIIKKQIERRNISLRFINIAELIKNYDLKAVGRFPIEMYFRVLLIPMLANYEKVIYIDIDLVLNTDIAKLYDIKIDNPIGACRDLYIRLDEEENKYYHMNYLENILKFTRDEIRNYINSGVLVFNIDFLIKNGIVNSFINKATMNQYLYPDQDILNLLLKSRITFLNAKWNFLAIPNLIARIPNSKYKDELMEVFNDPFIIHYAGGSKPWHGFRLDCYQEIWWSYARKTPYYEMFLRDIWLKDINNKIAFNNALDKNTVLATDRIQNHLSYKLGRLMIENSRSPLGWLKMPFSIISTIKEHKLLTKLTNKITKLPKIETLPDYKEALKYKNHMSYKLGEAFLKINKNWHKGGPIWFIFEMIKINKSKKNKAK